MAQVWEFMTDENTEFYLLDYQGNQANMKGNVSEIDPPEIVRGSDTRPRLGEAGAGHRPGMFEPMQVSVTMYGITTAVHNALFLAQGNRTIITMQVTGKARERYTGTTDSMSMTFKGHVLKTPFFGVTTSSETSEAEITLGINGVGQKVAGDEIYIEPMANRFEVNGVNLWA